MNFKSFKIKNHLFLVFLVIPMFVFSQREKAFEINQKLGRGINFGNMFEAPSEGEWGQVWQPEYSKMIHNLGFNHVRIPIRWEPAGRSSNMAPDYTINPNFLNRIKQVVDSALNNGLLAIINMHHHEALYENPESNKARFLAQWEQISDFFTDYPDSLIFEILNEPHGNLDADKWNIFIADALQKIRIKNPNRIVLIGMAEYGGLSGLSKLQIPDDQNIILTVHYYNPFQFTHQGAEWVGESSNAWLGTKWQDTEFERDVVKQEFAPLQQISELEKIPVHIGEFGAYNKADIVSREKWTTYLSRYMESLGWSWAYWEFCAGFGIYDPTTKTYLEPLVNALLHNSMPEAAQFVATLIYKSNFLSGYDGWNLFKQGSAVAQLTRNNGLLAVQISDGSSETWHVQLVKGSIKLYEGKKYKVTFTAKATEQRTLVAYAGMSSDPWSAYSGYDNFTISDSLKEYSFIFDMKTSDLNSRIVFDLGKSVSDITISEIRLEELTLNTTSIISLKTEVLIFPNPVKNSFRILNAEGFSSITLYNLSGKKVFSEKFINKIPIDISGLKPGVYILNLSNDKKNYAYKILKE